MLRASAIVVGLLITVLLCGLWSRTVRGLVGQLLHVVLDPVDAAISATMGWQQALISSLRATGESHGWTRTTVPTESVLSVLMAIGLCALVLCEFEMWGGSFAVGLGGDVRMPFGLTFNPGMSAAYAALAATVVFGLKLYHLNWQHRREGRMSWTLAAKMAATVPLLAAVTVVALVAAQYRTTKLAEQRLEEAQVTTAPSGFQAGGTASSATTESVTVESAAVSAERASLTAAAEKQLYWLNIGLTVVVLLAGGYALHWTTKLCMLLAALMMLGLAGVLWVVQYALHAMHLVLLGVAAVVQWMTRVASLCVGPLAQRMSARSRALTDIDDESQSEVGSSSPPEDSNGPADRLESEQSVAAAIDPEPRAGGDEAGERAGERALYDPFGADSGSSSN